MLDAPLFSEHFWGLKNQGYDTLSQNMNNGAKASKEFIDYLREMASLEEACCKSWLKMSKQLNPSASGSLQPYWEAIRDYSLQRYNTHIEVNQNLQNLIRAVQKYTEEQQTKHRANKEADAQTLQIVNLFITNTTQLERAKQTYHSRFMELHKLTAAADEQNSATKPRDIEKHEGKLKKAVDEYKYQIEKYNNTCSKFKSKMHEASRNFQDIEQYHLVQMKSFLKKLLQTLTSTNHKNQELLNTLQKHEDRFTINYLLGVFVKLKSTGIEIPTNVQFEEYNSNSQLTNNPSSSIGDLISLSSNTLATGATHSMSTNSLETGTPGSEMVATGNLLDLFTTTDLSPQQNQLQGDNKSECNSINNELPSLTTTTPVTTKKQTKKINNIFRRMRNSPTNNAMNSITSTNGALGNEKDKNGSSPGEMMVDEEGYTIRPPDTWPPHDSTGDKNGSDSSSDDDDDDDNGGALFKGLKINIRPLPNPNSNEDAIKSETSSINDDTINQQPRASISTNEDLIKAAQLIKLPPPNNAPTSIGNSRSHTPSSMILEHNIRDSRRNRAATALGQPISNSANTEFKVDFNKNKPFEAPVKATSATTALGQPISNSANTEFKVDFNKNKPFEAPVKATSVSPSFDVTFDDDDHISDVNDDDGRNDTIKASNTLATSHSASKEFDPWGLSSSSTKMTNTEPPPPLPVKSNTPVNTTQVLKEKHKPHNMPTLGNRDIPPIPMSLSLQSNTPHASLEGIPLAIAFTETFNAKFRHQPPPNHPYYSSTSGSNGGAGSIANIAPRDVHTNGRLVVSFPSSMIQQFDLFGGMEKLKVMEPVRFCLRKAERLRNVEACNISSTFVKSIENPSDDTFIVSVDLSGLYQRLKPQFTAQPNSPFFNIDLVQYDVTNSVRDTGCINTPISLAANWQFSTNETSISPVSSHLVVNYSWNWPHTEVGGITFRSPNSSSQILNHVGANGSGDANSQVRGEVRFLVVADGKPEKVQSLPPCIWNSEIYRASWRLELANAKQIGGLPDLTNNPTLDTNSQSRANMLTGYKGQACIKAKFSGLNKGTTNGPPVSVYPQPVACQFSVEGSIESGVGLEMNSSVFRISRHKYRLISGRYLWEPAPQQTASSSSLSSASPIIPSSHHQRQPQNNANSSSNDSSRFCV